MGGLLNNLMDMEPVLNVSTTNQQLIPPIPRSSCRIPRYNYADNDSYSTKKRRDYTTSNVTG